MSHIRALAIAFAIMTAAKISTSPARASAATESSKNPLIYIGTYTPKGKGIYVCRMDASDGSLSPPTLVAETPSPTFLDADARGRRLYAINEISRFGDEDAGSVSVFSIERKTGKLELSSQRSSVGSGPCHLMLDGAGRNVLVANYGGGSVAVLRVGADGQLGEASAFVQHAGRGADPDRQSEPHAHCMVLDASGRFAFACDLGLDKILIYRFDASTGKLVPNDPPFASTKPGAGPRHIAFHPNGRLAFVINELDSTIVVFKYDPRRGALEELHTVSTVPEDFKGGKWAAEIQVHPSGKFLYASNRRHDSIAVFEIDAKTGNLVCVQHEPTQGKTPRHFTLDPSGKFLLAANQDSGSVVVFRIDVKTGRLTPTGHRIEVPSPACIKFVP